MHTCIHAYMHTYIHTYIPIHTYIHTYKHTYIHTYIHTNPTYRTHRFWNTYHTYHSDLHFITFALFWMSTFMFQSQFPFSSYYAFVFTRSFSVHDFHVHVIFLPCSVHFPFAVILISSNFHFLLVFFCIYIFIFHVSCVACSFSCSLSCSFTSLHFIECAFRNTHTSFHGWGPKTLAQRVFPVKFDVSVVKLYAIQPCGRCGLWQLAANFGERDSCACRLAVPWLNFAMTLNQNESERFSAFIRPIVGVHASWFFYAFRTSPSCPSDARIKGMWPFFSFGLK